MDQLLRVTEIFYSLQGESNTVGLPTVFIRLTGCPLRCVYCDTAYAFSGGEKLSLAQITAETAKYNCRHITITGGEPLAQVACLELMVQLADADYHVSLETSGAMDISPVDPRVSVIMDIKTPGSGEVTKNLWQNIGSLKSKDEVKFVLADRADYEWAKQILVEHGLINTCPILLSPVYSTLNPSQLAEWVLEDKLPVRMQLQLHKILWGETPGK